MLNVETEGLGAAMEMLETLKKMGARAQSARLLAKEREDSNLNNAEIITRLIEQDRDFFSPDNEMISAIEVKMVQAMEKTIQKQLDRKSRNDKKKKKPGNQQSAKAAANQVASEGLYAGMDKATEIMRERIKAQRTAGGGSPEELSLEYANWKQAKYGYTTIGKLTGQLLDNLGPGKRNTKLGR